jgi:hypothetical protein
MPQWTELGAPAVPRIVQPIALPPDAAVEATLLADDAVVLQGYHLLPVQPETTDHRSEKPLPFLRDDALYAADGPLPAASWELGAPEIMRDIRFVPLALYPLRALPASRELRASTRLVLELRFLPGRGENPLRRPTGTITPELDRLYRAVFPNYDALAPAKADLLDPQGLSLVIVVHDSLAEAIQPLADWHNLAGLATEVATTSETGTTFSAIKAFLQDRYDNQGIEYALLVGDISLVPTGSQYGEVSDHKYGLLAGSDDTLDIAVGRFSVTTPAQVEHLVAKTPQSCTTFADRGGRGGCKCKETRRFGRRHSRAMLSTKSVKRIGCRIPNVVHD